jgi:hypothetical protein
MHPALVCLYSKKKKKLNQVQTRACFQRHIFECADEEFYRIMCYVMDISSVPVFSVWLG